MWLTACFAWKIYTREWKDSVGTCHQTPADLESKPLLLRKIKDAYGDFLENRNDFWLVFGQVIIVGIIIIVLTVLLLLGKISPEAGLPIISALSGFAIANKTSNTAKTRTEPEQAKEQVSP